VLSAADRGGLSPFALRVLTLLALLVAWEATARFGDRSFVAPPSRVIAAYGPTILANPKLVQALGVALVELIVAFVLAVVLGIGAGVGIGITDLGRRSLFPFVLLLYGLPQVVLLPLFILIFGLGPPSRIAFGFSHGVLPIIVNTVAGMRNVNPLLVAGARTMGASRAQILRHIIFPNMVATVFTGLRLAMTLTLLGVILAELFVSTNGIGNYTHIFSETFKPASLFGLILTLAIGAVLLNELVRLVENRFSRWKQG
jgi:ABC-type nitrate/sulfonate/bicarbonate transport system permease component